MGSQIRLTARDGFMPGAYEALPTGTTRGGLIILPEIFGINQYIRDMADFYAQHGFHSVAPAVMDRVEPNLDLTEDQAPQGRDIMHRVDPANALMDIGAAWERLRHQKVAALGYCWGGLLAYLAARDLQLTCAVSYYGGRIQENLDRTPKCPMQFHFAEADHLIPPTAVEKIKAAMPAQEFHIYQAGHGFDSHRRSTYVKPASDLARERTLNFLNHFFPCQ